MTCLMDYNIPRTIPNGKIDARRPIDQLTAGFTARGWELGVRLTRPLTRKAHGRGVGQRRVHGAGLLAAIQRKRDLVGRAGLPDLCRVDALREAIEGGTPQQKQALLKVLIAEIKVDGNEAAPLCRLPRAGVRIVGTLVARWTRTTNLRGNWR